MKTYTVTERDKVSCDLKSQYHWTESLPGLGTAGLKV